MQREHRFQPVSTERCQYPEASAVHRTDLHNGPGLQSQHIMFISKQNNKLICCPLPYYCVCEVLEKLEKRVK